MPMLRSGNVWQLWHFGVLFFNFGFEFCLHWFAKVTDFISLHFHNYQQIFVPSIIIPYYLPQAYSPLEHYRWTNKILHPLFPKLFFFPLSAWGPTRRRNSTGLAKLWGGWLIEQEPLSSVGVLQPYAKSSKGTSRTSLHCGILNKIHHWDFFPTIRSTWENEEIHTNELHTRTTFPVSSTKNSFFFGSPVVGLASNPSRLKYWLLRPFFCKEAICKGSPRKGLPYTAKAVPAKDYFTHLTLTIARKGRWVISPNYRASHPRRSCAVGDVVAKRYDVLCD